MIEKAFPSSVIAEEAVLGSILLQPELYDKIAAWIRDDNAFYQNNNKKIWKAIVELHKERTPVDSLTVFEKCKTMFGDKITAYELTGLSESVPTTSNAEYYAKIMWEKHIQRETAKSANKLFEVSFEDYDEVDDILTSHSRLITELMEIQPSKSKNIEDIVNEALEHIKEGNNLIPFGIGVLDYPAGGMTRKELTVLGGRPGHGKTTLMLNIMRSLIKQGFTVMLFNREMSNTEVMKKIAVIESNILLYENVRKNQYSDEGLVEMEMQMSDIKEKYKNLIMYDNVRNLADSIREISRFKPDIVIDDYIQLIQVEEIKEGRRFEIERIMQEYKWICKTENCTALLISQLNRDIERRIDPEPKMSDYSESGVIEQTAESALFVYYGYNFNSEEYDKYESKIISAKSRYGTVGSYIVGFNGNKCKFYRNRKVAFDATKDIK